MISMKVFQTLLLREWLQHRKGWLALGLIPVALMFLATVFGTVDAYGDDPGEMSGAGLMMIVSFGTAMILLVLAVAATAFQASGLARRDQQDRSIEFWLSLPVGQPQTLGAMLLMHVWLFPMMVVAIGLLGGLLIGPITVIKGLGLAGLTTMPWAALLVVIAAGTLRVFAGLVLAGLWALPFVLLMMAASAWLKRWGVPVLVAVVGVGGMVLKEYYGQAWLLDSVKALADNVGAALFPGAAGDAGFHLEEKTVLSGQLDGIAPWLMADLQQRVADLASPWLLLALALSAAGAWGVLYRRQQGR
ncbi:hypothetical protein [Ideonella paludis]|uniref:ABC transporter permease n=2 Tax=Ideonella paludis TaxID=1233411 RepID=A0ABS5DYC2_9BURK|nr:hypothetical protein [Ideonella paludis]